MRRKHLRDQRGAAMLLELLLVAAVLALAGVAVYQANHRSQTASNAPQPSSTTTAAAAPNSADGIASTAASSASQAASTESGISASADSSVNQLSQSSADTTSLGAVSNASF